MGTVLTNAAPDPSAAADAMYEQQRRALQARIDAALAQQPSFSPEEVEQRRAQNRDMEGLGLLGMLTGNEAFGAAGGQILKSALASRQPKVTDKGSYDPLTGKWTIDPGWQQQQLQAQMDRMEAGRGGVLERRAATEQARQDKIAADQRHAQLMQTLQGGKFVQVIGPDGKPQYMPAGQAAQTGATAAPTGGGQPSEGERKAASLLQRLRFSQGQLQQAVTENPEAAVGSVGNSVLQHTPLVGDYLATKTMSAARQRVENAQLDILDAALTLGTGAAYTREQLKGYAKSYFPQPGETDPKVLEDKKLRLQNVIRSAELAAGRALPVAPGATPPAATGGQPRVKVSF